MTTRRTAELRPEHLYKTVLLLFLLALVYRYFEPLSRVMLLAYAAAILAVALNAVVRRLPLSRPIATALLAGAVILVTTVALWFGSRALIDQARSFAEALPAMETALRERARNYGAALGVNLEAAGERVASMARNAVGDVRGQDVLGRAGGLLQWMAVPLLVFFGGIFALAKPNDRLLVPLLRVVPEDRRDDYRRMFERLGRRLTGWVKGQLLAMATVGALATLAFYVIGVPYALLLGVINGLTEFVPLIGPWAGGLPAILVAFIDDPAKGLWTAVAILAIQQLEAQVVTPMAMSRAARIQPFITLFSLVLFGSLFGFLGILLALPLVLLVWTVVETLWVERALHDDGAEIEPVVRE